MIKIRLILFIWFFSHISLSQTPEGLRHVVEKDFYIDCYIMVSPKKIKYNDTLSYYWFKSQKIHHTQGAAAGHLLDGTYLKYYNNGQIAEKGTFKKGIKNGIWQTWYTSGKIKTIHHFKNGILNGNFELYNESGKSITTGHYKNGVAKEKKLIKEQLENPQGKEEEKEKQKILKNLFKKKNTTEDDQTSESEKKEQRIEKRDKKKKEREEKRTAKK